EAVIPDRNETFDRVFVDLLERRKTLQIVAHPVVENVIGVGRALHQFIVRPCHRSWRKKHRQPEGPCEGLHGRPPLEHASAATAIAVRDVSLPYLLSLPIPARAQEKRAYVRTHPYYDDAPARRQANSCSLAFLPCEIFGATRLQKIDRKRRQIFLLQETK